MVDDLDLDDPDGREILLTLRTRYPQLPVVVELPTAAIRRHDDLLEGCTVVPPFSSDVLAAVVRGVVPA